MDMSIDSYRFLDFASRQIMKARAARQKPGVIPFAPLRKRLGECTVALVSTAGVARKDDQPFDQEHERRDPWWVIRASASFHSARRRKTFGPKRVQRSAAPADRGACDEEAVVAGEPLYRPDCKRSVRRLITSNG
jgi:hypothetical protein